MLLGRLLLLVALLAGLNAPASAAVEVAFYSREMGGDYFPHAFVTFKGTVDGTGEAVDTSLGFTATNLTPALLLGSVAGEVLVQEEREIARSNRQFSLVLSDAQYGAALAVVERWRTRAQPSYNLSRRNCIHFVGEIAEAIGLRVDYPRRLMRRPRSFLQHLRALNPQLAPSRPPEAVPPPP